MEFENSGLGKCIVLKESNTSYSLIYAIQSRQYIIVSDLNKETGSWLHGQYFRSDLDKALSCFNEEIKKLNKEAKNSRSLEEEKER